MHEDYDDDNYDEYYDSSHDDLESKYKHYFKFDPEAWDAWGKWLYGALNEVVEFSPNVWYIGGFPKEKFPVNSYFSNTGKDNTFQYLGNDYQNQPIWKKKYFVKDEINKIYTNHVRSHAAYFVKQPNHYRGIFDILN